MADKLRACLFDAAGNEESPFYTAFTDLPGIELLGATDQWDDVRAALREGQIELVIANLDDQAGAGMAVVEQVGQIAPACRVMGVSQRTEPAFIIGAMRAGCSQYVTWPIDPADLRNAIERIRASQRTTVQTSKRICVIGSSGGVGATTVACGLAIEFGHLGDRHAGLVDLNLEFGDVGCAFDCHPQHTIGDICRDGVDIDHHLISQAVAETNNNVDIIARPEDISDAREVSPEAVQNLFKLMGDLYPFVVVDLPRSFSFFSAAAVADADRTLIVTQLSVSSIRNATRIYRCLTEMGAAEDRIEIVLNRCKASFERITADEVASHFHRPIFGMVPNDYRRVQSALDLGTPVLADAPNSPARLAIQEIARNLAGDEYAPQVTPAPAGSSGLFGKLWRRGSK